MLSLKLEQTYENILYHFQNMLSQIWEKVSVNLKPTDRKMLVLGIQNPPELSSKQRVSQREKHKGHLLHLPVDCVHRD
jgi:hypothetical protein